MKIHVTGAPGDTVAHPGNAPEFLRVEMEQIPGMGVLVAMHQGRWLQAPAPRGGAGFVLGDGKLNYALEQVLEIYYRFQLVRYVQTSLDYQFIQNPGYNRDRGPAHVIGGRLRVSF